VLDRLEADRGDDGGREDRNENGERLPTAGGEHERTDEHAEPGRDRDVGRGGLEHETQPDGHRRVADQRDDDAVAGRHRTDAPQAQEALARIDVAALGVLHEVVEGGDLVQAQRAGELRDGLDRRPAGATEGDDQCGRKHDDARAARAAGRRDRAEMALGLADWRAGEAERTPELEHERVQLAELDGRGPSSRVGGGQWTIRSSCGVPLNRRPPSSVTVTMSSIRTPKRPER
jgi:hypothetical protein